MGIILHQKYGLNATIPQCFICGKQKNEIAMLGASYKEEAPMHMCIDKVPCDECKKLTEQGILLVVVKDNTDHDNPYRTGQIVVIKEEAFKKIFNDKMPSKRIAFVEETVFERTGMKEVADRMNEGASKEEKKEEKAK